MLLRFRFKNFKSFKDETILDMSATKINEYEGHIIRRAGQKVLPVASIFGANASGKSNIIEALRYMHQYVIFSLNYGGDTPKKEKDGFIKPTPFIFDSKSKEEESCFEVFFTDETDSKEKIYNYGFTVNFEGVVEEWLYIKAKTANDFRKVFYRNRKINKLDLTTFNNNIRNNLSIALEKETLLVSLGAKLKVSKLKIVRDWFIKNEFTDFGKPMENYFLSKLIPEDFAASKDIRKKVINYLSKFDDSIVDFKVEVIKGDTENDEKLKIDAIHKMSDGKGVASIPLQHESSGTLKMFALYPWLDDVLNSGGVLIIDELNANLHPLLVRLFIQTFLNKKLNPKNAQLVFTTHDVRQLSANILRRDEIWFVEKQNDGVSEIYSLSDFIGEDGTKIRKDENYEKNYLLGKYGAIPKLDHIKL